MEKSLEELVKEYKEKEKRVQNIETQIKTIPAQEEFKRLIDPLKDEFKSTLLESVFFASNEIISVRLGDLIEELSNLAGINVEDMDYDVNIINVYKEGSPHSLKKSRKAFWTEKPVDLSLTIQSKKTEHSPLFGEQASMKFYYNHKFYSYLSTLQADGETLFDHTYTVASRANKPSKNLITRLWIKKENMDDIICNFDLYDLAHPEDYPFFHPRELLLKTISNILNKQKEREIGMQKIIKRSGKSEKRK